MAWVVKPPVPGHDVGSHPGPDACLSRPSKSPRAAFPFMANTRSLSSDIGRDQAAPPVGSDRKRCSHEKLHVGEHGMTGLARLVLAGLLVLAASGTAPADDVLKAKIGVLRLSSSAPVFIAQDKGYFPRRRHGYRIEILRCGAADRGCD